MEVFMQKAPHWGVSSLWKASEKEYFQKLSQSKLN